MTFPSSAVLPTVDGLEFRAIRKDDAVAWLELVQRIAGFDGAPWHDQPSDLNEVLDSEVNPAALNTVVGVDKDAVPRAYGYVSKNPESRVGFAFGGVDPQWRRRGIGSAILAWQEEQLRLRALGDGTSEALLRSYVLEITPGHGEMLQRDGFVQVRVFTELARPLVQVPDPVVLDGITVVPFAQEFAEATRLAHNEAFADHWGSEQRTVKKWASLLTHENFRPEWTSVAIDDASGDVVGYQISMFDPTVRAASGVNEGYTELVGVRRAWRGRGIAPALLIDAMRRYQGAGMERACLDVDTENPSGAHVLYERLGYQPVPGHRSVAWDKAL